MWVVDILFLLIVLIAIGYHAPGRLWGLGLQGAALAIIGTYSTMPGWLLTSLWTIFAIVGVLLLATKLRRQWLTKPLYCRLAKLLPPMGATEQEAIDAGDVCWDGELFTGNPDWDKCFRQQTTKLTTEEQAFLDNQVQTVCSMIDDWKLTHTDHDLPDEIWTYLKQEKFFGMIIEPKFGGLGFSASAHSAVIMKLATKSISVAISAMVPNSLGPAELLEKYGTQAQQDHYLPKLACGDEIPSFALTATDSGSDAASMKDKGVVCEGEFEGKKVLGISLTWDKRYITLAPISTVLGLAFKLFDPNHLLGDKENLGITLCLIPTSHPGVEIGKRHSPMNMGFMNGPTRGDNVFIPMDWIIGGQERIGQGWAMLMNCLADGRAISLPALSAATSKLCYRTTGAYAHVREQFNVPIGEFEGVQEAMAKIAGLGYIIEATRAFTVATVDQGLKPSVPSAIAKYHCTEMAREVLNHAMDVHAGRALQVGPRNYLATAYQAMPISITVEGANILTRNLIIFGQGLVRAHPYLLKEYALLKDESQTKAIREFDQVLLSHMGYTMQNFCRVLVLGLFGQWFVKNRFITKNNYFASVNRMSAVLGLLSDMTLFILGGKLKRKERLSARLGDILSYLYLSSAVMHHFHHSNRSEDHRLHYEWAMQYCDYQLKRAVQRFLHNFPVRWLARVMGWLIQPWGRHAQLPHDDLDHELAKVMLLPGDYREQYTKGMFINESADDPVGRMDHALNKLIAAEPVLDRLETALKSGDIKANGEWSTQLQMALESDLINESEKRLLEDYEQARVEAIAVDEFTNEQLKGK